MLIENSETQEAVEAASRAVIDEWYQLRELTEKRNQASGVADRYMKMYRLALTQLRELESLTAKEDTLNGLCWIMSFCDQKYTALRPVIEKLENDMGVMTERINSRE